MTTSRSLDRGVAEKKVDPSYLEMLQTGMSRAVTNLSNSVKGLTQQEKELLPFVDDGNDPTGLGYSLSIMGLSVGAGVLGGMIAGPLATVGSIATIALTLAGEKNDKAMAESEPALVNIYNSLTGENVSAVKYFNFKDDDTYGKFLKNAFFVVAEGAIFGQTAKVIGKVLKRTGIGKVLSKVRKSKTKNPVDKPVKLKEPIDSKLTQKEVDDILRPSIAETQIATREAELTAELKAGLPPIPSDVPNKISEATTEELTRATQAKLAMNELDRTDRALGRVKDISKKMPERIKHYEALRPPALPSHIKAPIDNASTKRVKATRLIRNLDLENDPDKLVKQLDKVEENLIGAYSDELADGGQTIKSGGPSTAEKLASAEAAKIGSGKVMITTTEQSVALLKLEADLVASGKLTPEIAERINKNLDALQANRAIVASKSGAELAYFGQTEDLIDDISGMRGLISEGMLTAKRFKGRKAKKAQKAMQELQEGLTNKTTQLSKILAGAEAHADPAATIRAAHVAIRIYADNILGKAAVMKAIKNGTIDSLVATLDTVVKNPLSGLNIIMSVPINGSKYLLRTVGTKAGRSKVVRNFTHLDPSNTASHLATRFGFDDTTRLGRAGNALTGVTTGVLRTTDDALTATFDDVALYHALHGENLIRKRIGLPKVKLNDVFDGKVSSDFYKRLAKSKALFHQKLQYRSAGPDVMKEVPLVAKPAWLLMKFSSELRDSKIPVVSTLGTGIGMFSRVVYNTADRVGSKTALALLDGSKGWKEIKKHPVSAALLTAVSVDQVMKLNERLTIYNAFGDSKKAAGRLGLQPTYELFGVKVPLQDIGIFGDAIKWTHVLFNAGEMYLSNGDESEAKKAYNLAGLLWHAMTSDSPVMRNVEDVMEMAAYDEPAINNETGVGFKRSSSDMIIKTLDGFVPSGELFYKTITALKGYRPNKTFLSYLAQASGFKAGNITAAPVNLFGDFVGSGRYESPEHFSEGFLKQLSNSNYKDFKNNSDKILTFLVGAGAMEDFGHVAVPNVAGDGIEYLSITTLEGENSFLAKTLRDKINKLPRNVEAFTTITKDNIVKGSKSKAFVKLSAADYNDLSRMVSLHPKDSAEIIKSWYENTQTLMESKDITVGQKRALNVMIKKFVKFAGLDIKSSTGEVIIPKGGVYGPSAVMRKSLSPYFPTKLVNDGEKGLSDMFIHIIDTPLKKMTPAMQKVYKSYYSFYRRHFKETLRRGEKVSDRSQTSLTHLLSDKYSRKSVLLMMHNRVNQMVKSLGALSPSAISESVALDEQENKDNTQNQR